MTIRIAAREFMSHLERNANHLGHVPDHLTAATPSTQGNRRSNAAVPACARDSSCRMLTSTSALTLERCGCLWEMVQLPAVKWYFIYGLPVIVAAIVIGRRLNRRLSGDGFFRYVYIGLIAIGAVLAAQAMR